MNTPTILLFTSLVLLSAYSKHSILAMTAQDAPKTAPDAHALSLTSPTHIILDNGQAIDQKVIVTHPKKDPTDCTQTQGKELLDCMACQSPENLKKNIMSFNDRMAHYYFLHLSLEDYHEALQHFTEKEWHDFCQSRNVQTRKHFPQTIHEQRKMLTALYLEACYNFFERLWLKKSDTDPQNLEILIRTFNEKHRTGAIDNATCNYTYNQFYWQRKKLFTKL